MQHRQSSLRLLGKKSLTKLHVTNDNIPHGNSNQKLVLDQLQWWESVCINSGLKSSRGQKKGEGAGPLSGSLLQFSHYKGGQNHSRKHLLHSLSLCLQLPTSFPNLFTFLPPLFFSVLCSSSRLPGWMWCKWVTSWRHESLYILLQALLIFKLASELLQGKEASKRMWRIFQHEFYFLHWSSSL